MMTQTTRHHGGTALSASQAGSALIISLILLLVLTLIGVTAMNTTLLQEKMSRNALDMNMSFQAAEAAIREGEDFLQQATLPAFDGTNGLYTGTVDTIQRYETTGWTWSTTQTRTYSGTIDKVSAPQYYIEELDETVPAGESLVVGFSPTQTVKRFYRVTARGTGLTTTSETIIQAMYAR